MSKIPWFPYTYNLSFDFNYLPNPMKKSFQINYRILHEKNSIDDMIESFDQPLKEYEDDLPDFPVMDIGIGLGSGTVYFASKGKRVYAIDNEPILLKWLEDKVNTYDKKKLDIEFIKQSYPAITLPESKFSCILISNLLHFCENGYDGIRNDLKTITQYLVSDGFILVRVHATDHVANYEGQDYFKYFFTEEEIKGLLVEAEFELMYLSKYYKKGFKAAVKHKKEWLTRYLVELKKVDPTLPENQEWINQHSIQEGEKCYVAIFRKK